MSEFKGELSIVAEIIAAMEGQADIQLGRVLDVGEPTQHELHIETLHDAIEDLETDLTDTRAELAESDSDALFLFDAVLKASDQIDKLYVELSRLRERNRNQRIELKRLNQAHVNKSYRILRQEQYIDGLEDVVEAVTSSTRVR
jgi:chromosome segregation ATPase